MKNKITHCEDGKFYGLVIIEDGDEGYISPLISHSTARRGAKAKQPKVSQRICYTGDEAMLTLPRLYENLGHGEDIDLAPEGDLIDKHELIGWLEETLKTENPTAHVKELLDFLESTTYRHKPAEPQK